MSEAAEDDRVGRITVMVTHKIAAVKLGDCTLVVHDTAITETDASDEPTDRTGVFDRLTDSVSISRVLFGVRDTHTLSAYSTLFAFSVVCMRVNNTPRNPCKVIIWQERFHKSDKQTTQ